MSIWQWVDKKGIKQQLQKQFKKNYNCLIDNIDASVNLELANLFDAK